MPWFEYEGQTPGGTAIAGRIEAIGPQRAREELARMQIARKPDCPKTTWSSSTNNWPRSPKPVSPSMKDWLNLPAI